MKNYLQKMMYVQRVEIFIQIVRTATPLNRLRGIFACRFLEDLHYKPLPLPRFRNYRIVNVLNSPTLERSLGQTIDMRDRILKNWKMVQTISRIVSRSNPRPMLAALFVILGQHFRII